MPTGYPSDGPVQAGGGYLCRLVPGHPRANSRGYVREHVLIAERALGRPVPLGVEVHHFNEDRGDNGRGNLVICEDLAYHRLLHKRREAQLACGDPNKRRCIYCREFDLPEQMYRNPGNGQFWHRPCRRACRAPRGAGVN